MLLRATSAVIILPPGGQSVPCVDKGLTTPVVASDRHAQGNSGDAVEGGSASLAGATGAAGGSTAVDTGVVKPSNGAHLPQGHVQDPAPEVGQEPSASGGNVDAAVPSASNEDGAWVDVPSPTRTKKHKSGLFGGLFKSRKGKAEVSHSSLTISPRCIYVQLCGDVEKIRTGCCGGRTRWFDAIVIRNPTAVTKEYAHGVVFVVLSCNERFLVILRTPFHTLCIPLSCLVTGAGC